MGDLENEMVSEAFEQATQCVELLATSGRLPDADLLRLYACYKQATVGACRGSRPGMFSLAARRKHDAWKALGDLPPLEAKKQYVEILTELQPNWMTGGEEAGQPRGLGISVSTPVRTEEEATGTETTPLDLVKAGRTDELARLAALDCDKPDAEGLGPLHWAADRGHVDVVRLLLARGATVDLRDPDGQTPLHYAASCGHAGAVRALLEAGADRAARDSDGLTPAQVAAAEVSAMLAHTDTG